MEQWSENDEVQWLTCHEGIDALFSYWLDLALEAVRHNKFLFDTVRVHFPSDDAFRAHLNRHRQVFTQTPRDPISQTASQHVGRALIEANILPSGYINLYNLIFSAYHTLEHDPSTPTLPPLSVVRQRWIADVQLTLDSYAHGMTRHITTLGELAETDALTGLQNRRGFQRDVTSYFEIQPTAPATLIVWDLDHFKMLNDEHGHPKGDSTLQTVASIQLAYARSTDTVGRLGGDEFAWWMPGTISLSAVSKRLDAWANAIYSATNLTCSIGISRYPADGKTFDALYAAADNALYRVKNSGRAGWSVSHDPTVTCFVSSPQDLP